MKMNRLLEFLRPNHGETIATFGVACLVKKLKGKKELRGGTPDDRQAAKEWIPLFPHQAAVTV